MSELLEVNHVSYAYHSIDGETETLADISFHIKEGEFAAIVGPSGCGKSTLLSLICGLLKPEKGEILLDGKSIAGEKERIGYMLQKDYLFEWRSIYSNVMLGLEIQKKKSEKYTKRVDQMLKDYGLWDFRNVRPSQLSGGMRQRAALIRTLALQPELLLLDEPFSALDYQTRLSVCEDIYRIIKKEQKTAVLVTHDLSEAISMADRIFVLSKRPAEIKKEIKLDFNMKERTPMQVRNAPQFRDYFNLIWKELNELYPDGKKEKTHRAVHASFSFPVFCGFMGSGRRIFVDRQLYFQQSAADRKNRLADASGWKPDHAHRCDAL